MQLLKIVVCILSCASIVACSTDGGESAGADGPTEPELRTALLDLAERDQEARFAMVEAMRSAEPGPDGAIRFDELGTELIKAVQAIDAESAAFLNEMIDEHGWPTFDMVGTDGAHAAWLLAQHADEDRELQAEVLELMEPLVEQGQAEPSKFAMLTDRVLRGRGEPQVYGTQFTSDENGVQRPQPTIDWANINTRRASVGLGTIEEYAELMRETYGGEVSTEPLPE